MGSPKMGEVGNFRIVYFLQFSYLKAAHTLAPKIPSRTYSAQVDKADVVIPGVGGKSAGGKVLQGPGERLSLP